MAPVFGQQLALFKADIAVLGKSLDGEDVAVIEARAFRLALDLRLAVFVMRIRSPLAIAISPRPVHLETVGL